MLTLDTPSEVGLCDLDHVDVPEFKHQFMYSWLDGKCEYEKCQKPITEAPLILWLDAPNESNGERPAYFCSDECLEAWFNSPLDNPCTGN